MCSPGKVYISVCHQTFDPFYPYLPSLLPPLVTIKLFSVSVSLCLSCCSFLPIKVIFDNSYTVVFEWELSKESGYLGFSSGLIIALLLSIMYALNTCLKQNTLTYIVSFVFCCHFYICNRRVLQSTL